MNKRVLVNTFIPYVFIFAALACDHVMADDDTPYKTAINAIRELGGEVDVLRNGPQYPKDPISVIMKGRHVDDADMEHLRKLTVFRSIKITNTSISDDGLRGISLHHTLTGLYLSRNRIGNGAIPHINTLKDLRLLNLSWTDVTDEGVKALAQMKRLRCVQLDGTNITNEALKTLSDLPMIDSIEASTTCVDDKGVAHLAKCHALMSLHLSGTRISDESIRIAGRLPRMQFLIANYTRITDDSLDTILAMPFLLFFEAEGTGMSQEARDKIEKLLSNERYKRMEKLQRELPEDANRRTKKGTFNFIEPNK